MIGWLPLLQDSLYFLVGADEICGPVSIHIFFPGHAFLGSYIVGCLAWNISR
jgi:hypothetical protein